MSYYRVNFPFDSFVKRKANFTEATYYMYASTKIFARH